MRMLISLVALLVLVGCKSTEINSFTSGADVQQLTEGEDRLWYGSDQLDKALRKARQLHKNDELNAYLQQINDRLFPEFKGKIRVRAHKAPYLNAFALANGSIYVNLGLISTLENEAQLAAVLAHEGIHFVEKHSARQRAFAQNSAGLAVAVTLLGVPLAGELIAMEAISGYSREHELEADNLGYQRMVKAGYSPAESVKAFEALAREAKAAAKEGPFFFSSHPKLQQRIENFNALISTEDNPEQGIVATDDYHQRVEPVRAFVLRKKLDAGQYAEVIASLERENLEQIYPVYGDHFLGEALYLRNEEGDLNRAAEVLTSALKKHPAEADPHRVLGMIYMKQGELDSARLSFEKYLELNQDSERAAFVQLYLADLDKKIDKE